jgi:hypothetical protein
MDWVVIGEQQKITCFNSIFYRESQDPSIFKLFIDNIALKYLLGHSQVKQGCPILNLQGCITFCISKVVKKRPNINVIFTRLRQSSGCFELEKSVNFQGCKYLLV